MYKVLSSIFEVTILLVDVTVMQHYMDSASAPDPYLASNQITRFVPRQKSATKEKAISLKQLVQFLKGQQNDPHSEDTVLVLWNGSDHFTGTLVGADTVEVPPTLRTRLAALRSNKKPKVAMKDDPPKETASALRASPRRRQR